MQRVQTTPLACLASVVDSAIAPADNATRYLQALGFAVIERELMWHPFKTPL